MEATSGSGAWFSSQWPGRSHVLSQQGFPHQATQDIIWVIISVFYQSSLVLMLRIVSKNNYLIPRGALVIGNHW